MDGIRKTVPITPGKIQKSKPAKKEVTEKVPKDKVNLGKTGEEPSLVHRTLRGIAKIAGGAVGAVPGASLGGIRGASKENVISVKPAEAKFMRAAGATGGLLVGLTIGAGGGPVGLAAGAILGPILGSAFGGAFPGAIDGSVAATRGAAKGAVAGAKKGSQVAGKAVDWIFSKFSGSHKNEAKPQKGKVD